MTARDAELMVKEVKSLVIIYRCWFLSCWRLFVEEEEGQSSRRLGENFASSLVWTISRCTSIFSLIIFCFMQLIYFNKSTIVSRLHRLDHLFSTRQSALPRSRKFNVSALQSIISLIPVMIPVNFRPMHWYFLAATFAYFSRVDYATRRPKTEQESGLLVPMNIALRRRLNTYMKTHQHFYFRPTVLCICKHTAKMPQHYRIVQMYS